MKGHLERHTKWITLKSPGKRDSNLRGPGEFYIFKMTGVWGSPSSKFQSPAELKLPPHKVVFPNGISSDFHWWLRENPLYFRMNFLTLLTSQEIPNSLRVPNESTATLSSQQRDWQGNLQVSSPQPPDTLTTSQPSQPWVQLCLSQFLGQCDWSLKQKCLLDKKIFNGPYCVPNQSSLQEHH